MNIRIADVADAKDILRIYTPYITDTAITFEYDVPDPAAFEERIRNTLLKYPYLVAEEEGRIIGYAYAGAFRPRAAYQHSVEVSIYVDRQWGGKGTGRQLYQALEQILLRQNVFVLYACITATEREQDDYLTDGSIRFHERMGYHPAGRHRLCGYKFGQWYSMIWMEKVIHDRPEKPEPFLPFPQIRTSVSESL